MANDTIELENEMRSVERGRRQMLEQITTFQRHLQADEIWLQMHLAEAEGSQETLEELRALKTYIGELQAQVFALDDLLLELRSERELWDNPDLILAS